MPSIGHFSLYCEPRLTATDPTKADQMRFVSLDVFYSDSEEILASLSNDDSDFEDEASGLYRRKNYDRENAHEKIMTKAMSIKHFVN